MKAVKYILFLTLFICGSRLLAISVDVSGFVTNAGSPQRLTRVYINYPSNDTVVFTDTTGYYKVTVNTSRNQGSVEAFFVDCRRDTIREFRNFSPNRNTLRADLYGCLSNILISGNVTNAGVPAVGVNVSVKHSNTVNTVITDALGNYRDTLYGRASFDTVTVSFLDCNSDTIEEKRFFSPTTTVLQIDLAGCIRLSPAVVRGTIYNYVNNYINQYVYFSIDRFKTILDSARIDTNSGSYQKILQFAQPESIVSRVSDCRSLIQEDSMIVRLNDTIVIDLDYCKGDSVKLGGWVLQNGKGTGESGLYVYQYVYDTIQQKMDFYDSISVYRGGYYEIDRPVFSDFLLKVVSSVKDAPFSSTYYPAGFKWDADLSYAVRPGNRGPINITLLSHKKGNGPYEISGKIAFDQSLVKVGYMGQGIYLLNDQKQPIQFVDLTTEEKFLFQPKDIGKYYVWYDQCGIPTEPIPVEITKENSVVRELIVTANSLGISYGKFVGREEMVNEDQIDVYPNPFDEFITLSSESDLTVTISNLNGTHIKKMESIPPGVNTIETAELPPGVYLIQLESGGRLQIQKLIKK